MENVVKSAAQKAASVAWAAPLVAFIFNFVAKNIPNPGTISNLVVLGVGLILYVTGLASGIFALKNRAPAEPHVATPAIVGIALSVLCLLLVGSVVFTNR